ncbi:MAG: CRISPR-associated endonuclease Cas2 [Thermomicrobium sp.]|nr:CRISPR-associated endonuclease Cas2 [Thermomicrobium sp.]MDW8006154.1 CRISPR-associated endonuclease Cas2 [Thermomicrobium sp.]
MLVVICYDIVDDSKRTRLYKWLQGYGTPVQRSVFECDLRANELDRVRRYLRRIADPREDGVRVYTLCEACARRVEIVAGTPREAPPDFLIV